METTRQTEKLCDRCDVRFTFNPITQSEPNMKTNSTLSYLKIHLISLAWLCYWVLPSHAQ